MKDFLRISFLLLVMLFAFTASAPQQVPQQQNAQIQQQQQQQQRQLEYYRQETQKGYKQYSVPSRKMVAPDPESIELITIAVPGKLMVNDGWMAFKLDEDNMEPLSCAGCANFYFMVKRSATPHQAEDSLYYFYYYVFIYSNSFYSDGNLASTYLKGVQFTLNGIPVFSTNYILAEPGVPTYAAWIRYVEPTNQIAIEPTNINVH